jgi:hypothetical protein
LKNEIKKKNIQKDKKKIEIVSQKKT